jgi:hypothetical protein
MTRYLIRLGAAGGWMVWDRLKHRPAALHGRELVQLSRDAAEAALGRLVGANLRGNRSLASQTETWQIKFQGKVVDCRDELDAKSVARKLVKMDFPITAQSIDRDGRVYLIEFPEMWTWLSE